MAPTGIATYTDQISGMVVSWCPCAVAVGVAALVSVGAILVGRATHSRASKGGVVGLAGVLVLAVVLMGGYGMLNSILGDGWSADLPPSPTRSRRAGRGVIRSRALSCFSGCPRGAAVLVGGVLVYGLGYTLVFSFSAGTAPTASEAALSRTPTLPSGRDLRASPMATVAEKRRPSRGWRSPCLPRSGCRSHDRRRQRCVDPATTPEGAAQLAAVEVRVLSDVDPLATEVYRDWAMPRRCRRRGLVARTRNVQSLPDPTPGSRRTSWTPEPWVSVTRGHPDQGDRRP